MRTILAASFAALTLAPIAAADAVYHSAHVALSPVGDAPLRSGFVENIHASGPVVFARELYVLNGAAPDMTYSVVLHVFGQLDATCSTPLFEGVTATIMTNAAGNGTASVVVTPEAIDGLHGS